VIAKSESDVTAMLDCRRNTQTELAALGIDAHQINSIEASAEFANTCIKEASAVAPDSGFRAALVECMWTTYMNLRTIDGAVKNAVELHNEEVMGKLRTLQVTATLPPGTISKSASCHADEP
jgi:hypothetical protein